MKLGEIKTCGTDEILARIHLRLTADDLNLTELADGSGVILDIPSGQVLTLNHLGMTIVKALKVGADSHLAIVNRICREYDVDAATAEDDSREFVQQLAGFIDC